MDYYYYYLYTIYYDILCTIADLPHLIFRLHRPRDSPRRFSRNCSGAVCDRELKLGMTDPPFKPDIMHLFIFRSGHVNRGVAMGF